MATITGDPIASKCLDVICERPVEVAIMLRMILFGDMIECMAASDILRAEVKKRID